MDGEALARLRVEAGVLESVVCVRVDDLCALLAERDALAAERATHAGEILDAYPCASPTCPAEQCILGRRIQAREAERASVAPVLAAADDWVRGHRGTLNGCPGCVALSLAVVAWRAARGETG